VSIELNRLDIFWLGGMFPLAPEIISRLDGPPTAAIGAVISLSPDVPAFTKR
jgi:hypothetical protein